MIKDYSNIPANKRIVNDTKEDITISLRDKCIMVPVKIKVNDSLSVKATTSEDLALINKQCEDYKLLLEDEGPDITDIVVNITPNIREGESNSKANAIIATFNLKGGTEPVIYSLDGADANKFILENNVIKAKNNLTEGIYTIIVSAVDATKETYSETDKVTVLKAYPLITDANISINNNIREGETNSLIGSNIGTIQVVGGTSPYTIKLTGNNADKLEIVDNNIKAKQNLTEGEYNITFNITDKNNKTFKKTSNFSVLKAFPLITNIEATLENNLREGELNTKANAQIGSLRAIGGTTPITFTLQGTHANKFAIEGNNLKIGNTNLTQGSYSISIKATDKNNKTFTKALNINVLEAFPLITSVKITKTNNLREGEANVNKGALVANFQVIGGTAPFTYSLTGIDASKFIIEGTSIKVGNTALTAKTYSISIHVQDTNNKIFDAPTTIEVLAAYPQITSSSIQKNQNLIEGSTAVAVNSIVGTFKTIGGTEPFTYILRTDNVNGVDNNNFAIDGSNLKVISKNLITKTYKVAYTVRDANNRTLNVNETITVTAPAITALNITPVDNLKAPLAENTVVANLSTVGGIAPYTYSLKTSTQDNAEFIIDGNTVKNKANIDTNATKNITVIVTDKNSKTKEQTAAIEITVASV